MGESGEPSIALGAGEGCYDGLESYECEEIVSTSQATGSTAADSPAAAPAQHEQLPDALPMEQVQKSNNETAHEDSTRSSVGAVNLRTLASATACEATLERNQGTGAHMAFMTAESSEEAVGGSRTRTERAPSMADRDSSAPEARSKQNTQAPVERVCDLVVDMDAAAAAVSAALTGILGGASRRGISSDGGVPLMRQSAAAGPGPPIPPPPPPPRRSMSHMQSSQFAAMQQASVFPQPHPLAPHLAFPNRPGSQQHPGMARSTSAVFRYRGGMPGARVSLVSGAPGMGYEEPVSEGPRWRNSISGPMGDLGQVPYGTYQFTAPFAQPAPPPPPPPPPYRATGGRALGHSQSLNDRSPRVQHVPGMTVPYHSIPGLLGGAHQGLTAIPAQLAPGVPTVTLGQQEPVLHHAPLSAPLLSGGSMAGTLGAGQQVAGRGYTPTQMAQLLSLQAQALQAQVLQAQQQQQRQLRAGLGLQHSASHVQQQHQQLNAIAAAAAAASQQQQQHQLAAAIAAAAWQQQRLGTGDAAAGQAVHTTPSSPAVSGPSSGPLRAPVLSTALLDNFGLMPPGSHATPSPSASPIKEPSQSSPGAVLSPGAEPAAPSRPPPLHLPQIWEGGPASCGSPAHSSVMDLATSNLDPSSVLQPYRSALSAALSGLQLGRLPPAAAQQLLQEHDLMLSLAGVVGDVFLNSGVSSSSSGGASGSGGTASMPHVDAQGDVALMRAAAQRHVAECSTLSEPFKRGLLVLARVMALLSAECTAAGSSTAAAAPEGQRQRQLQTAELHAAVCRVLHILAAADELFFASMAAVLPPLGQEGSGGGSTRGSSVGGSSRLPGPEEGSERGSISFPNTPTHKPGPASAAAADRELARQLLASLCALLSSAVEVLQQRQHAHAQWSRGAQAQAHTLGADVDTAAGLARQQLQQQQQQVAEQLAANEAMRRFLNRSVSAPANRQPTPTNEATEHARVLTSLFNSITMRSARSSAPGESSDAAANGGGMGLSSLALAQLFGDDPEVLGAAAAALSYSGSGADDAPCSEASASVLASFLESFTARSSSLGLTSMMDRAASMDLQGFGPLATPPRTSPANPLAMRAELASVLGQHQHQQLQHAGQLGTAAAAGGVFPAGSATGVGVYGPYGAPMVEAAGAGGGPLEQSAGPALQAVRLHMPFGGAHPSLSEQSHAHVHASALQAKQQQRQADALEAGPGELLSGSVTGGEASAALSGGELDVLQWDADTIQAAMRLLQGAGQLE